MSRGYKTFFMLYSIVHEILTEDKFENSLNTFCQNHVTQVFIMLINGWHFNICKHDGFHAQSS